MLNRKKRAFTLIELLVVISIIALLIGILLPALSAARTNAQILNCTTNVKGHGTALEFYLNENQEVYPAADKDDVAGTQDEPSLHWSNMFGPAGAAPGAGQTPKEYRLMTEYMNSDEAALCPLDRGFKKNEHGGTAFEMFGSSYILGNRSWTEIRIGARKQQGDWWLIEGHRDSSIKTPSKKVTIGDLVMRNPDVTPSKSSHFWHNSKEPLRFSGVFGDGHAEEMGRRMKPFTVNKKAQTVDANLIRKLAGAVADPDEEGIYY